MRTLLFTLCLVFLPMLALAEESQDASVNEPKITTHESKDKTIYEYSINSYVYAIRVVPKDSAPYDLVKVNNDSEFLRSDQPGNILIPSWQVTTWQ